MSKNNYLEILLDDQPELRKVSSTVELPLSKEDESLLMDMLKYVTDSVDEDLAEKYNLKPSVGLAAPQVGVNKNMIAIYFEEIDDEDNVVITQHALVNPKIISHSEQLAFIGSGEGCLSVEDEHPGHVYRYARITVQAYDALKKENVTVRARNLEAMILQHEIDHLNGVLFYDHINKDNPFELKAEAREI